MQLKSKTESMFLKIAGDVLSSRVMVVPTVILILDGSWITWNAESDVSSSTIEVDVQTGVRSVVIAIIIKKLISNDDKSLSTE